VLGQHRRAVVAAGGRDALRRLPPAARDAALRDAMAREGALHPAFARPDGHYQVGPLGGGPGAGECPCAWRVAQCGGGRRAPLFWALPKPPPPQHAPAPSPPAPPQTLRALSDGAVSLLLPPDAAACPALRPLLRELFACCVLRSAMLYFTPAAVNAVRRGWVGI
jgi:hypothetical protein